ncbi:d-isomer specific 2-hydroxyacid dehydrogenase [Fusarium albosuccineum]|uniref:D-isomer specific 2-hydroxyacid dehydrogenase n=1 Tax=Fusarium albosuccineum TaxID=1237068 RepID=A0A8H4LFQ2_9HYPO|nr:d-isomer specific 2-hydroxyacid dehydrogenase [Fusarium albosuccineum]
MARKISLGKEKVLIFIPSPPNEEWISRVQTRFPGLKVVWFNNSKPGGYVSPDEIARDIWDGVTIYCSFMPASADRMRNTRFVQLATAGNDRWLENEAFHSPNVVFCSASGCQSPQIAEWVMGTWLASQHEFARFAENQRRGFWERPTPANIQDSVGLRMGILGYGAIGRQCGKLAKAMGMQVLAYTRGPRATQESRLDRSYCVPGTGDPEGLIPDQWFSGSSKEAINHFLSQDLDIIVLCLPLADDNRGMLGPEQFEIMSKKKTFLSNVARGALVQTDALITALETGKIRGAALDVTDPEPLPLENECLLD